MKMIGELNDRVLQALLAYRAMAMVRADMTILP